MATGQSQRALISPYTDWNDPSVSSVTIARGRRRLVGRARTLVQNSDLLCLLFFYCSTPFPVELSSVLPMEISAQTLFLRWCSLRSALYICLCYFSSYGIRSSTHVTKSPTSPDITEQRLFSESEHLAIQKQSRSFRDGPVFCSYRLTCVLVGSYVWSLNVFVTDPSLTYLPSFLQEPLVWPLRAPS